MTNEVLAKILCHNLCSLVASWYELGIEPVFAPVPDEPPTTLPFAQRG